MTSLAEILFDTLNDVREDPLIKAAQVLADAVENYYAPKFNRHRVRCEELRTSLAAAEAERNGMFARLQTCAGRLIEKTDDLAATRERLKAVEAERDALLRAGEK